ncbi:hypothetical protein ACA910_014950 [Epithemia clementina (nom. ined.)]
MAAAAAISSNGRRKNGQSPSSSSSSEDATFLYRQVLGPIRMEFITQFQYPQHAFRHLAPQQYHSASHNNYTNNSNNNNKKQTPRSRKLQRELIEYQLNLPIELSSSIFCRALESRMDLIRALITGPADTPYANGCFLFDVLVRDYPTKPPTVQFLTTGAGRVRFNPNLYACGKVCLSLLGTWSGPGWVPDQSTLLQVLVSIQGLILVPDPYFNEPGFEAQRNSKLGEQESRRYSLNIRRYTLQYAIDAYLCALLRDCHIPFTTTATTAAAAASIHHNHNIHSIHNPYDFESTFIHSSIHEAVTMLMAKSSSTGTTSSSSWGKKAAAVAAAAPSNRKRRRCLRTTKMAAVPTTTPSTPAISLPPPPPSTFSMPATAAAAAATTTTTASAATPPLEYPEFRQVFVVHFCQRAPAIRQQVQEWIKDDPTIQPLGEQVCTHLQLLVEHYPQHTRGGGGDGGGKARAAAAASHNSHGTTSQDSL